MKILMLTDRMDCGGAETHITQLMRGLIDRGEEVLLVSSGGNLAEEAERHGVRQYCAPTCSHNPLVWICIRARLRRLIRKEAVDILHAHARIPALIMHGLGKCGACEIVTVHAKFRSNFLLSRLCNWGERTVAVSEDLRDYVCNTYGVSANRIRVIPNGIDCRRFFPPERPSNGCDVIFASRLDADCARGAELLCAVVPSLFQDYPHLCIKIAGGGSEQERIERLAKQVNQSVGAQVIEVMGWVREMPALLRSGSVFVGVSRAAMEAAACGCAVILCGNEGYGGILTPMTFEKHLASNFCSRGEILPNNDRLKRDLRLLLSSDEIRAQCGAACRSMVEEHLSADLMCDETLSLYQEAVSQKRRIYITVGGYFGCGNLGDDAILLGFLTAMKSIAPQIGISALTAEPKKSRLRFGVRCVNRINPIAVRLAIARSDAFLCGGGSLLQNLTSNRSLSYYLGLLRLATWLRKTTVLLAGGIGPLIGKRARRRVAHVLSHCRYVSLRDEESLRRLNAMGVDAGRLHKTADLALLMPLPPSERGSAILQAHGLTAQANYLCVVLRGGVSCALIRDRILAATRMLCRRHGLYPLFLVLDAKNDAETAQMAARKLGGAVLFPQEPTDAAAILSVARATVTMRLHALILSTAVKTPAVGIPADGRDRKIGAFAKAAGQEWLSSETFTVIALVESVETAMNDTSRRVILDDAVEQMKDEIRSDLLQIIETVEG